MTKAGIIALIGAPNVGKSTLLNRIVGSKLAIVTPKAQTTRARMTGIAMRGDAQLAFIDTPGIFAPRRRLERAMVAAAWAGINGADRVVLLVDAARAAPASGYVDPETAEIVAALRARRRSAILVLNKIDRVARPKLLAVAEAHDKAGVFDRVFMISALDGDGVEDLVSHLAEGLPEGPWLYPSDQLSDVPLRLLAAEITREQAFLQLHQELPYALTVATERWEERPDGSARIDQTVYVARDSQKGIVLGKDGSRIKAIGEAARAALQALLERRVHLFLHVKVKADWMERVEHYREIGLDYDA